MVLFVSAASRCGTAQGTNGLSARIIPHFPGKTTGSYSPAPWGGARPPGALEHRPVRRPGSTLRLRRRQAVDEMVHVVVVKPLGFFQHADLLKAQPERDFLCAGVAGGDGDNQLLELQFR